MNASIYIGPTEGAIKSGLETKDDLLGLKGGGSLVWMHVCVCLCAPACVMKKKKAVWERSDGYPRESQRRCARLTGYLDSDALRAVVRLSQAGETEEERERGRARKREKTHKSDSGGYKISICCSAGGKHVEDCLTAS